MWKTVRIAILLLVLLWAAGHTWLERYSSTRWKDPLWVGVFPINADGSPTAQRYVESLDGATFADIEAFFEREGHRYGKQVIHLALRWMLDQGAASGLWGARRPDQLQPVDGIGGWSLDAKTKAEIDDILREEIVDPVGPEFMAPPARS